MSFHDTTDEQFMRRCLHLASLGGYRVHPNPMVGAVIVHERKVIGEGYHSKFGGDHAEVVALKSVAKTDQHLLSKSHMFISLEPCNHHGKTPPCSDAILEAGIKKVTIANVDPNPDVQGNSIEKLIAHGVEVRQGLLEDEGALLLRKFYQYHSSKLPYVVLKWAQSKDLFLSKEGAATKLSNEQSDLLTHKWREELDAIMVGTDTAIIDDPQLTNRRSSGRSPKRYVLDRTNRLPKHLKLFTDGHSTTIFTTDHNYGSFDSSIKIVTFETSDWTIENLILRVRIEGHNTLLIEGGANIHRSVIDANLWNEARIIHTPKQLSSGIKAPLLDGKLINSYNLDQDKIFIINNLHNSNNLIPN